MKKIIKYNLIALLALVFFMYSCDEEDTTGHSELTVTNPTLTISGGSNSFTETDSVFTFNVTLSEAQIVDVALYVAQTDGNAVEGDDFVIVNSNSRVYIPANTTSGVLELKVLRDDLIEGVETFELTIGDEKTANSTLTPVVVTFTINNYTDELFSFEMSWETNVLDIIGLDLDADEAVDLRMVIVDATDSSIVHVVDGSSFESFSPSVDTLSDGTYLLDGDYLIATDIYSTIEAGDFDAPLTLDLTLDFYQPGIYNNSLLNYEAAFTNEFACEGYRIYLANLSKLGDTYSFDENAFSTPSSPITGDWQGTECEFVYGYDSQIKTFMNCEGLSISGLAFGILEDPGWWGEPIVEGGTIPFDVDMNAGTITIPLQDYCTTIYSGSLYPYEIEGSGTIDMSGEYPTAIINYYIYQEGWDFSGYVYAIGGMATPYFVATITLDPDGFPAKKSSHSEIKLEKPDKNR